MQRYIAIIAGGVVLAVSAGAAVAEGAAPIDPKLEARMAAEKEARKQCKIDICKVFATRSAEGGPIACDVTKTFLEGDISQRILSGRIGWPWGNAQCATHIELDRAELAKTLAQPEATIKLKAHELKCTVDNQKNGAGRRRRWLCAKSFGGARSYIQGRQGCQRQAELEQHRRSHACPGRHLVGHDC